MSDLFSDDPIRQVLEAKLREAAEELSVLLGRGAGGPTPPVPATSPSPAREAGPAHRREAQDEEAAGEFDFPRSGAALGPATASGRRPTPSGGTGPGPGSRPDPEPAPADPAAALTDGLSLQRATLGAMRGFLEHLEALAAQQRQMMSELHALRAWHQRIQVRGPNHFSY